MTRAQIIYKVMACLDEIVPLGEEVILGGEPLPIHDYVETFLDDAAKDVLTIGPMHLCSNTFSKPVIQVDTPMYVIYPSDCIRMNTIICPGWLIPVSRLINPSRELQAYMLAKNTYTVGKARPQAALTDKIIPTPTGTPPANVDTLTKVIELFHPTPSEVPTNDKATITYVKATAAEVCNTELIPSICWLTAAKVLQAAGKQEAKSAYEAFQNAIKILQ